MMNKINYLTLFSFLLVVNIYGQSMVKGYVYESENRGYLSEVKVTVLDASTNRFITELFSDTDGMFKTNLMAGSYTFRAEHKIFHTKSIEILIEESKPKYFPNIELERKPGYIFDITVALRDPDGKFAENRGGVNIEVYNNSVDSMVYVLRDYDKPDFQFTMEQGNHYSYMIRKAGYYSKRMEAYVNVKGCILCFDGIGNVKPGITDNLTEGLKMGTLLANIELTPIVKQKSIKIEGVHFNKNSSRLKSKTVASLDNISSMLMNNPQIIIEIGAHSDSRGDDEVNYALSDRRAKAVVDYLLNVGVNNNQLFSKGYGEQKLVNKCKNDVPCSDKEHEVNRRVEFMVIQSVNSDNNYSLEKIKEGERMEKLLQEVLNQEVVQIGDGQALPDDFDSKIAKEIEEEEKLKREKYEKERKKATLEKKNIELQKEKNVIASKTNDESKLNSNLHDRPSTSNLSIKYVNPVKDAPQRVSSIINISDSLIRGYSIRIGRSAEMISGEDVILSNHGVVYEQLCSDGNYNYMVGLFKVKDNAESFMKKFIISRYPQADIIQIKK